MVARRAITVQLACVKRGQSRLLRVCEVGCSAALSAAICPIPKLIVAIPFQALCAFCWPPPLPSVRRDDHRQRHHGEC